MWWETCSLGCALGIVCSQQKQGGERLQVGAAYTLRVPAGDSAAQALSQWLNEPTAHGGVPRNGQEEALTSIRPARRGQIKTCPRTRGEPEAWTFGHTVTAKNMAQSRDGARSTNPQISSWGFWLAEASKQESPHEGLQGSVSRDTDQSRGREKESGSGGGEGEREDSAALTRF